MPPPARGRATCSRVPDAPGQVLGVFPTAVYVGFTADEGSELVAVETADGLRLPRAVTLAAASSARPLRAVRAGDDAHVGEGRLDVGPLALDVVRWWSPRRPGTVTTSTSTGYDDARLDAVSRLLPALPADLEDRLGSLTRALEDSGSADLPDAVTALLGLGAGLTPQGDDVLAGLLVGLAAVPRASPLARRLGDVVTGLAASRTTTLSAALLRDAADGFAVPALVDLVDGLHRSSTRIGPPPTGRSPTSSYGCSPSGTRLVPRWPTVRSPPPGCTRRRPPEEKVS